MRRICAKAATAGAILFSIGLAPIRADTIEIASTFSGGIHASGTTAPGFMNYYVGYSVPSTPIERRNYFIFDLSGVSGEIVSASLKLFLPGGPSMASGYISSEMTEDYRLSGSPFAWTSFADAFAGTAPGPMLGAMFGTMGMGAPYGITTISAMAGGGDVVIDLTPGALADLSAALGSHFLIAGRLSDIHPAAPGTPPSELVFAYTDIPDPMIPMPRLEIVTVPGPSGAGVIGAAMLLSRRRRHAY